MKARPSQETEIDVPGEADALWRLFEATLAEHGRRPAPGLESGPTARRLRARFEQVVGTDGWNRRRPLVTEYVRTGALIAVIISDLTAEPEEVDEWTTEKAARIVEEQYHLIRARVAMARWTARRRRAA